MLVASFHDAHAVFLRCDELSVGADLNVGEAWTNAQPKTAALAN
jgi:hypothetical protein